MQHLQVFHVDGRYLALLDDSEDARTDVEVALQVVYVALQPHVLE